MLFFGTGRTPCRIRKGKICAKAVSLSIMGKNISLVNRDPAAFDQDSLLEYKELTIRYPYCQCARLMFLLNLRQTDDQAAYKAALPATAINLPDRARLKEQVESLRPMPAPRTVPVPTQEEALPRRHVESFSPWSQALPKSRNTTRQRQAEPGFTPAPAVNVEMVRTLLNKARNGQETPRKTDANSIIDNFLNGNSRHPVAIDDTFDYDAYDPDTGHSNREDFSFGSETLAQMYLENNAPGKAIAIYENLRLKFPEKSSYFANLIRNVKRDYHIK